MFNYEGYGERLARQSAETIQRQKIERMTLEEKITQWSESLNEKERSEGYTMDFFVARFKDAPPRIGAVLFSLGWARKRSWRVGEPHRRVWVAAKNKGN